MPSPIEVPKRTNSGRKILEVLTAFGVASKADFQRLPRNQKEYFLRRLYKGFTSAQDDILDDLKNTGGLKFHFQSNGDLGSGSANIPNQTFLTKSAFYANRTLVTFPLREVTNRSQLRSIAGMPRHEWPSIQPAYKSLMRFGKDDCQHYLIDRAAFDDLIVALFELKPAIECGVATVLPVFSDTTRLFRKKSLRLTAANFRDHELHAQFFEHGSLEQGRSQAGLSQLLLPHFAGVPLERILEIREKETDLYCEFQRRIERMLAGASSTDSEAKIIEFLRDVDSGVREIDRRFREIQAAYRRKNVMILLQFMGVGLAAFVPIDAEARKSLAGILGSISLFDYIKTKEAKSESLSGMRANACYLPWLIFKDRKSPVPN